MEISVILAHPERHSFNHAIAQAACRTLKRGGHTVRFHDLYEEGFDPLLPSAEPNPAQSLEFLAAGAANETLLVFQDLAAAPAVTCATRLALNSSITGPPTGAVLFKRDYSVQGFGTAIGAAFDGVNYQILSSYSAQISSTVFKTQLAAGVAGTPAPFAEVGQGATGLAEDNFPRAFYNGSGAGGIGEFLFVRNSKVSNTAYHLLSKRVASNGTDIDLTMPVIDNASRGVLNGAVAVSIGAQYLVVWMDGRIPDAQPAWQTNVFGVFLDDTQVGDNVPPYLKAVANAQPTFGASPLTVYFNIAGSTGLPDSIGWDFGDGTTAAKGQTSHIYQNGGAYTAVLSLVRAGFAMHDFATILVDSQALGGGSGPPELIGGILGPVSAGVNTAAVITNASVNLDFTKPHNDRLQIYGRFDTSVLPVSIDGQQCTLVIAGVTYSFTTDTNGNYTSPAGQSPVVRFSVNGFSGYFSLLTSADDLVAAFAALGAGNEDVGQPGQALPVPFTLTFDLVQLDSILNTIYLAKAGKNGRASYVLGHTGSLASGFLYITGAKAVESGGKVKTHAFTVTGNMLPGGGEQLAQAGAGNWQITFGNYAEALPAGSLSTNASSNLIFYRAAKGKTSGISQFAYDTRTGNFGLLFKKLPAQGPAYSGMALASSSILRADMALSFSLDLAAGTAFQASVFVRFGRQAGSKRWTLR